MSDRPVSYDTVTKLAVGTSLSDLSIADLKMLLIHMTGNKEAVDPILDKEELIRYISYIKHPESYEGVAPSIFQSKVARKDVECGFSKAELIGTGGFGDVYRGLCNKTPCAIKRFKIHRRDQLPKQRMELEIMRQMKHTNICLFLGYCEVKDHLLIITELMLGNLDVYLKKNPKLSVFQRINIIHQVALGLNWLHRAIPQVLHLDLKLENVLFKDNVMKLTDFGLSAILEQPDIGLVAPTRAPGNVGHMAPEVIKAREFNAKADVYSFGVLAWEILRGHEWEEEIVQQLKDDKIPIDGSLRDVVKRAVCERSLRPRVPDEWVPGLKKLVTDCWHADQTQRPTMDDVFQRLTVIERELVSQFCRQYMSPETKEYKFWTTTFYKNCDSPVPWEHFVVEFYRLLKLEPPDLDARDISDPKVKHMLFFKLALNAAHSGMVSLDCFAKVIAACGPVIEKDVTFFDRIQALLQHRWFHPYLNESPAEFMAGQPEGVFVVRFSVQPRVPFTITRVMKDPSGRLTLQQTRIYSTEEGYRVGEESRTLANQRFKALSEIIESPDVIAALNLKSFLQFSVSPGQRLFAKPLVDTNYAPYIPSPLLEDLIALGNRSDEKIPSVAQQPSSSSSTSSPGKR